MIITFETKITRNDAAYATIIQYLNNNHVSCSTYLAPLAIGDKEEIQIKSELTQEQSEKLTALVKGSGALLTHHSALPRIGIQPDKARFGFEYNGVRFSDEDFSIFAGLCAVDGKESCAQMMKACQDNGLHCTRMGAFKPRTSPYSFQGLGVDCLPYVFELAGKYGIKIIAMEVLEPNDIERIDQALEAAGRPTGVLLQVGTRNCQNVSLLKALGQQNKYPVLLKRGFGITLHESLFAAEHIAAAGNCQIIFCLRGVKSVGAAPHRNLVDFGHISTVKRLTRLPVCADPSHSAGSRSPGVDGISDIQHASAQAVISGVNMLLVDFHPQPEKALCDGHQALHTDELPLFVEDMKLCRQTYLRRCKMLSEQ